MPISLSLLANPALPNDNGWQDRHNAAVSRWAPLATIPPVNQKQRAERALVLLIEGLAEYHRAFPEILEDYYLGDEGMKDAAKAVRVLLNGETGRLDCGTLDGLLCRLGGVE